jgi:hypothetical protein
VVSLGTTLTVAARARSPIIGLRYELSLYFAWYALSIRLRITPSIGSKRTSFVIPAAVIRPALQRIAA